jgi:hypothetical protein
MPVQQTTIVSAQPIVMLEPDPTLALHWSHAVTGAGGSASTVTTPAAWVEALERLFPVLTLVNLDTPGDWASAMTRCKLLPHTKQIPLHAFTWKADGERWQAAQRAGADQLWLLAALWDQWPALIQRHLHPVVLYLEGWDAPLSELARQGLAELNHRHYFEQHEYLEAAWNAEARPIRTMYQGILQAGVAFLQIERNNWAGAIKMLRRALPRLRPLPEVCQGVQIAKFRTAVETIHTEISQLGPDHLADFDQRRFPQIEYEGSV